MTNELFPIVGGLLLGSLLAVLPAVRLRVAAVLVIALGVLATIASGEFRISWGFLLIDVPLVTLAAVAAATTVRRLRTMGVTPGNPRPRG